MFCFCNYMKICTKNVWTNFLFFSKHLQNKYSDPVAFLKRGLTFLWFFKIQSMAAKVRFFYDFDTSKSDCVSWGIITNVLFLPIFRTWKISSGTANIVPREKNGGCSHEFFQFLNQVNLMLWTGSDKMIYWLGRYSFPLFFLIR